MKRIRFIKKHKNPVLPLEVFAARIRVRSIIEKIYGPEYVYLLYKRTKKETRRD